MARIPIFEARIVDSDEGIANISLVDFPAVESNFLAFAKNKMPQKFAVENEEQRMIIGVLMRADFPIYRYSAEYGEYYLRFSKESVRIMAEKLFKDGNQNSVNIMHLENSNVDGVNMIQAFIKDTEKGISPAGFEDIEDGSLFAQFKVENDDIWEQIKEGTFKGFSIEGLFDTVQVDFSKIKQNKTIGLMAKLKERLKKLLQEFAEVETDKGTLYIQGELEVGVEVFDGEDNPAEDGEYTTDDKVIVVADGKVTEIREKETTESEEQVEVEARRQKFNKVKAAFEESYEDKERRIYEAIAAKGFDCWIVEAGDDFAIAEIWSEADMDYKHYRFEVSWDEEGNAIVGDPVEVVSEFVTVEEAEKIDEIRDEEVAETGETVEEQFEEQESAETETEEVVDEKEQRIAALEDEVASIKDEIQVLKDSLAAISNEPAAEPVTEEFKKVSANLNTTGNRKLDNLIRIAQA